MCNDKIANFRIDWEEIGELIKTAALLIGFLLLTSMSANDAHATPNLGGDQYGHNEVRRSGSVVGGKVLAIRVIEIREEASGTTGSMLGGIIGAAVGAATGKNRYQYESGAIGTAVGGVLGNMIEKKVASSSVQGYEFLVKTDKGEALSITQADNPGLNVGSPCNIVIGSVTRVTP